MELTGKILAIVVGLFLGALIVGVVAALPAMLLWNWLVPTIFGLTQITFWQAFGLIFLCSILFKSGNIQSSN